MHHQLTFIVLGIGLSIVTSACSSAPPSQVQAPAAKRTGHLVPKRADIDSVSAAQPDTDTQNESSSTPTESEAPAAQSDDSQFSLAALKKKATPIDVMTGRETAYLIDYANSGAVSAASTACAEKAKKVEAAAWAELAEKAAKEVRDAKPNRPPDASDSKPGESAQAKAPSKDEGADPALEAAEAEETAIAEKAEAVRTACLREAREKFEADVLRFRRDGLGHIQLVIYRRNGSSLKELYVANVELDDSAANKVKVEIKESGSGRRPIMRDRSKFELLLPNEYSLELQDPQFGRLPYVAKVGLVAN